jgi:hypothetical protein
LGFQSGFFGNPLSSGIAGKLKNIRDKAIAMEIYAGQIWRVDWFCDPYPHPWRVMPVPTAPDGTAASAAILSGCRVTLGQAA